MQGKQRIPSYMKSHYMQKNSNIKSKEVDKLFKVLAIYLSLCWVTNVFLWALCVTSWDLNDAEYILLKEGFAGGINKTLPIVLAEIVSLFPYIFICIFLFSIQFTYNFYVINIKKRNFIKRDFLLPILLIIIYLYISYVLFNKFRGFYDDLGIWDNNNKFIDSMSLLIIIPNVTLPTFLIIIYIASRQESIDILNIFKYKPFAIIVCVLKGVSQLGIFVYVPYVSYSKGYGTECMYIYVASGKTEVQKDRIYRSISSDGGEVIDKLSKNIDGGEKIYSLSSYVYSEDKDYLNIMVFSVREWHNEYKDGEKYLVINDGRDMMGDSKGVLMSLKKEFIAKRTANNAECFNGEK